MRVPWARLRDREQDLRRQVRAEDWATAAQTANTLANYHRLGYEVNGCKSQTHYKAALKYAKQRDGLKAKP